MFGLALHDFIQLDFLSPVRNRDGQSFMAIGVKDPVLGEPAMRALHRVIRSCPEPMLLPEAGHFVQEWGEAVASAALTHFGLD